MATSVFKENFFRLISDGDKIVLLRDDGRTRDCYLYTNPFCTSFSIRTETPMHSFETFGGKINYAPGFIEHSAELSFRGGDIRAIERPLVMGVDIFDRLSVTDYLDIINEKIKAR